MKDEVMSFMMPMNLAVVVLAIGLAFVIYILWEHFSEEK